MPVFHRIFAIALALVPNVVNAFPERLTQSISARRAVKQDEPQSTFFNDIEVPPIPDLSGKSFTSDISHGYWLVDAFSPYCRHCQSLAPTLQKVYEFYYTSDPLSTASKDSTHRGESFTDYYNFKFAKLDCIAFGSSCADIGVVQYPTLTLFKDGENIARVKGDMSMKALSKFIETELEKIKPGSRPIDGPDLPDAKATRTKQKETKSGTASTKKDSTNNIPSRAEVVERVGLAAMSTDKVNEQGLSVNLAFNTFPQRVTESTDPWLIKFYAPWCQHCQHMAPHWTAMAKEMKARLNVGEVNCEVERKLCREMDVDAFPTIMYFKGLEKVLYEGGRGLGDFISFAEKAVESNAGIQYVTAIQFEKLEKTDEVLFLYLCNHAITEEDVIALQRLPIHLIGYAKLVKSDDLELAKRFHVFNWPALLVIRSGRATRYDYNSPQAIRDVTAIVKWIRKVRLPLVPELTAGSGRELMAGRFLTLAILSRVNSEEFAASKREMKNAALEWMDRQDLVLQLETQELRDAKQTQIEEAEELDDDRALRHAKSIRIDINDIEQKEVGFAWVDGVFWDQWIRSSFGISVTHDGAKVVIVDHDNRRYWDKTATNNPLVPSRSSIIEALPKIVVSPPKLRSKPLGSTTFYYLYQTYIAIRSHNFMTTIGILFCIVALLVFWRRRRRRYSWTTTKSEPNHRAGGFLARSSEQANGKVD